MPLGSFFSSVVSSILFAALVLLCAPRALAQTDSNALAGMLEAMQQAAKPPPEAQVPGAAATVKFPQEGYAYSAGQQELVMTHLATSSQIAVRASQAFSPTTAKSALRTSVGAPKRAKNKPHRGRAFSAVGARTVYGMQQAVYVHMVSSKQPRPAVVVEVRANKTVPAELVKAADKVAASVRFLKIKPLPEQQLSFGGGFDGDVMSLTVPGDANTVEHKAKNATLQTTMVPGSLSIFFRPIAPEANRLDVAMAAAELKPKGKVKRVAKGKMVTFETVTPDGDPVKGRYFYRALRKDLMVVVTEQHLAAMHDPVYEKRLVAIAKSIRLKPGAHRLDRDAMRRFAGHTVEHYSGYSDYSGYTSSSSLMFKLCPDGRAYDRSSFSASTGGGSGGYSTAGQNVGRWKVVKRHRGFQLWVELPRGGLRRFNFTHFETGGVIHESGKPWIMDKARCR